MDECRIDGGVDLISYKLPNWNFRELVNVARSSGELIYQ